MTNPNLAEIDDTVDPEVHIRYTQLVGQIKQARERLIARTNELSIRRETITRELLAEVDDLPNQDDAPKLKF